MTTDTNAQLMISVYLKRDTHENGMTLQEYAAGVIAGTQPILSQDAFAYQFGSTADFMRVVLDWAAANELTVIESGSDSATIKLLGTVAQFRSLFNIDLQLITDATRSYYTHSGQLTIPTDIDDVVEMVLGLDNSAIIPNHAAEFTPATFTPNAYPTKVAVTPMEIASAYNLPAGDGYGSSVGLLELTYSGYVAGYNTTDVTNSFSRIGLAAPTIIDVLVNSATRSTTSDAESMLNIVCAGAIVPRANIAYYIAPNNFQGFYDAIMACATDTINNPTTLGISWGTTEIYSTFLDSALQACVAKGITCFCASGDNGASNIIYPSTSVYAISAGGTSLFLTPSGEWDNETAWVGSGGGISTLTTLPEWQVGLYSSTISSTGTVGTPTLITQRGVPDISAPSDPATGIQFYVNGVLSQYGGTSAAAPLLAGMFTRLTHMWGKRMTFANTLFYANPLAFTDIILGDNREGSAQGYTTTVGWDAVTGLGSPKGAEIYKLLHIGSTYPKLNYGFRPNSGHTYPRQSSGVR